MVPSTGGRSNQYRQQKGNFCDPGRWFRGGGGGGWFSGGVEKAALRPGDMVIVPEKAFSANSRFKNVLEASQIAYAVGIAIQVARTF